MRRLALAGVCVALVGCGSDDEPTATGPKYQEPPEGVVLDLPRNGSSGNEPWAGADDDGWDGWWMRWPTGAQVMAAAPLGEDLVFVLDGLPGYTDWSHPDPESLPFARSKTVMNRVSATGELLWSVPVPYTNQIFVTGSRIVLMGNGFAVFDEGGVQLREVGFGEDVWMTGAAPLEEGGFVTVVEAPSIGVPPATDWDPFDDADPDAPITKLPVLGSDFVLDETVPAALIRWDANGNAVERTRLVGTGTSPSPAVSYIAEDGDGVLWLVSSAASLEWGDVTFERPTTPGLFAFGLDRQGQPRTTSTFDLPGGTGYGGFSVSPSFGVLYSGGAKDVVVVDGQPRPLDQLDAVGETGVAVALTAPDAAPAVWELGWGPYKAAGGVNGLVVGSSIENIATARVGWCPEPNAPCDAYQLTDTNIGSPSFVVTPGRAAYFFSQFRAEPDGDQSLQWKLTLMRLEH